MDDENKNPACIPFYVHENVMQHYNIANRRMLLALIAVCVMAIMTILIFTNAYTTREKNRNDAYRNEILAYIQQLHGTEASYEQDTVP